MDGIRTKSPHGGHLKNIGNLENSSAKLSALKRKSSVKTHLGEREKKSKRDYRSDGGSQ